MLPSISTSHAFLLIAGIVVYLSNLFLIISISFTDPGIVLPSTAAISPPPLLMPISNMNESKTVDEHTNAHPYAHLMAAPPKSMLLYISCYYNIPNAFHSF